MLNDHERVLQLYDELKAGGMLDMRLLTTALASAIKRNKPEKVIAIQADAKAEGYEVTHSCFAAPFLFVVTFSSSVVIVILSSSAPQSKAMYS